MVDESGIWHNEEDDKENVRDRKRQDIAARRQCSSSDGHLGATDLCRKSSPTAKDNDAQIAGSHRCQHWTRLCSALFHVVVACF
ncbi:uncharacterized protein [Drosophila bipectinata]